MITFTSSSAFRVMSHFEIAEEKRSLTELTEKEIEIIQELAGKQSPSGIAAENILQHLDSIDYPEVFDADLDDPKREAFIAEESLVTIFPNPATDELYIDIESINADNKYALHLYDITGKEVKSQQLWSSTLNVIDINTLSKGLYFIKIEENDKVKAVNKFVKE